MQSRQHLLHPPIPFPNDIGRRYNLDTIVESQEHHLNDAEGAQNYFKKVCQIVATLETSNFDRRRFTTTQGMSHLPTVALDFLMASNEIRCSMVSQVLQHSGAYSKRLHSRTFVKWSDFSMLADHLRWQNEGCDTFELTQSSGGGCMYFYL